MEDGTVKKVFAIIALVLVLVPNILWAETREATNTFLQFHEDVNSAYASYRMALFQTNKKNQTKSLENALNFQQQWQAITEKYGEDPPEVYAADPQWKPTLVNIGDITSMSIREILAEKLSEAHDTLEAIRDQLGALRQRNQVSTFSDHVNNYHAVMESLLHLELKAYDIDDKALLIIREQLAVLDYLAIKMQENAPPQYMKKDPFKKAMNGVFGSLKNLRQAVDENNPDKVVRAVKELKPAYAKVFVKFG
jgi:hypothetical protein